MRELLNLLINSKKIIIIVTLFFSLIAAIFAYSIKPNYEVSSVIGVGYYIDNNNKIHKIELPHEINEELREKFITIPNEKGENSILHYVNVIKNSYIVIKSISTSPDKAFKNIEKVQQFLIDKHQTKLDNKIKNLGLLATNKRNDEITDIQKKIDRDYEVLEQLKTTYDYSALQLSKELEYINLNNEQQLTILKSAIRNLALLLDVYTTELQELEEAIELLKSSDYDLSIYILLSTEKRQVSTELQVKKTELERIEGKLNLIESQFEMNKKLFSEKKNLEEALRKNQEEALEKLIQDKLEEIIKIKSTTQKNEYSNTNIYGEISTKQLPIQKLAITAMGFVAGLFLSIFIVLIRQSFLQEQK